VIEAKYTFLKSEQVVWNERDEGKRSLQRKEKNRDAKGPGLESWCEKTCEGERTWGIVATK
jgi:hypothetical protein